MAVAVRRVTAFIEGPPIHGSRLAPLPVLQQILELGWADLPDIGVAPKALLDRARRDAAPPAPGAFRSLNTWISTLVMAALFATVRVVFNGCTSALARSL